MSAPPVITPPSASLTLSSFQDFGEGPMAFTGRREQSTFPFIINELDIFIFRTLFLN